MGACWHTLRDKSARWLYQFSSVCGVSGFAVKGVGESFGKWQSPLTSSASALLNWLSHLTGSVACVVSMTRRCSAEYDCNQPVGAT